MPYNFAEIEKRLKKLGFKIVRQKRSHVIFSDGKTVFPVPKHGGKQISIGVEKKILKILKITREKFDEI